MKIAMVSTPYVSVPPKGYGGTELIVSLLTEHLMRRGHEVVLYATGDSNTTAELRSLYQQAVWPPKKEFLNPAIEIDHAAWAVQDASENGVDLIHMHCTLGVALTRFTNIPMVYTIHHPFEQEYYDYYRQYPAVDYVAISKFQERKHQGLPKIRTIHHGLNIKEFKFNARKEGYLAFLGRIAAVKGVDLAIAAAKKAGMKLKIAGDIQPIHRKYYEEQIAPEIDGTQIEYLGEADFAMKNQLLKNAAAMLFPIQWDEPFGLVLVESMACGTPVIAYPGGSVPEIIKDGISGYVVRSVDEMTKRIHDLPRISPRLVREYAERYFDAQRMVDEYEALYLDVVAQQQPRRRMRIMGAR